MVCSTSICKWYIGNAASLLGHLNDADRPCGCMNLTAMSASSLLISCIIPIHQRCSYMQHACLKGKTSISASMAFEPKLCISAISSSSLHLFVGILRLSRGSN
ncbi:unnamed protein product [Meganyctiphanes norvegica]|uniref:Uncharacterized protein n=1 Tax=Meganyctiphanes norvegica TaxID=48144 RepID=A0AAV2RP06_MEGNR